MASGDVIGTPPTTPVTGPVTFGQPSAGALSYLLIDAFDVSGANDGVWVDCREYDIGSVTFSGIATAAVITIEGSNAPTKPANNVHGSALGNNTAGTNSPAITISALPRWIKAHLTTVGTGTVTITATLRSVAT